MSSSDTPPTSSRSRPRPLPTVVLVAMTLFGFTLLGVAWFGAAGELAVAAQMDWLVLGALPGLAFIVAGARGMWSREVYELDRGVERLDADVAALHDALADAVEVVVAPDGPADEVVAVPTGSTYHRRDCPILVGKDDVRKLTAKQRSSGRRTPCRRCEPEGQTAS